MKELNKKDKNKDFCHSKRVDFFIEKLSAKMIRLKRLSWAMRIQYRRPSTSAGSNLMRSSRPAAWSSSQFLEDSFNSPLIKMKNAYRNKCWKMFARIRRQRNDRIAFCFSWKNFRLNLLLGADLSFLTRWPWILSRIKRFVIFFLQEFRKIIVFNETTKV